MTHKEEIKYWAEHPDGTRVWLKQEGFDWALLQDREINWMVTNGIYIVDNQWAELRKAQADGKQLQYMQHLMHPCEEKVYDRILGWDSMRNTSPNDWRIKSEEPVYEYQWLYPYSTPNGDYFGITEHLKESQAEKEWIKILESKRERR